MDPGLHFKIKLLALPDGQLLKAVENEGNDTARFPKFADLFTKDDQHKALNFMNTIYERSIALNVVLTMSGEPAVPVYFSGARFKTWAWIIGASTKKSHEEILKEMIRLSNEIPDTLLNNHYAGGQTAELMTLKEELAARDEQLDRMQAQLQKSDQSLKEFLYSVSHDLREPLRSVYGFLELFQKKYKDSLEGDASIYIQYALDGAQRANRMIRDLANYSRSGQPSGNREVVDCQNLLHVVIQNLDRSIQESGARILWNNLPVVTGFSSELIRLFQNLIENSIKFCEKSKSPQIKISAVEESNFYIFSVKDNGIGISEESLTNIFQIFQRAHRHAGYDGSGIGLALCQKIVEWHGGKIWAESNPGQGSTFFFSLRKHV